MLKSLAALLVSGLLVCALAVQSLADNPPAPAVISVQANGTVNYTPDTARVTLGIRSESPNASTAIETINKNSAQVIAALKAIGIADSAIKTVEYNLQYRQPTVAPVATSQASAASNGAYVAFALLQVTAPIALAGKVLDTAMGAGANESFGLSYQTSNYESLYRSALGKAVASARASAEALASAAHVKIVDIQSISNSAEAQPLTRGVAMGMASAGAPIVAGTDAVTATVFVVYRIR